MIRSALYLCKVRHRRFKPKAHHLAYRVFNILLDLDEARTLSEKSRVFGYNRRALLAFYETDHGDGSDRPLKDQITRMVLARGLGAGGPVQVMTLPRVLGFVFNPISLFFVHDEGGTLSAIVHEVNNTFGDRCFYVLPANGQTPVHQRADKRMHVSPFMDMDYEYAFQVTPPGETYALGIQMIRDGELWLTASQSGERRPFTDRDLFRAWLRHPLLTLKVVVGIHFEALRIWLKGVGYRHPPAKAAGEDTKAPA